MQNEKIDAYIEKSQEFAQPILIHLRELIHKACPEVDEKIKWGFPIFDYKKSILCSLASFKEHCAFGFWFSDKMEDPDKIFYTGTETAMGQFGRIKSLSNLPKDEILIRYIHQAMALIDAGVKLSKKESIPNSKDLIVPEILLQELNKNNKAMATFEHFSNSNKKEYIEWINEAKTDSTKQKRTETAIEWLSEGKIKNWKYVRK